MTGTGSDKQAGRALGVDLGGKRVGLAVSDTAGTLAMPLFTFVRSAERSKDHDLIAKVAKEEGAVVVVVGMPLNLAGSRAEAAEAVEAEVAELASLLGPQGIEVHTFDERLTSAAASRLLAGATQESARQVALSTSKRSLASGLGGAKQSGRVDRAAAAFILQGWLDWRRSATCR